MLDELTVTRVVSASPERCHALIADVESYPRWARDVKSVEVESSDELGRPLQVAFRVAAMGRSATYTLAYDHSDAPRRVSWSLVQGDIVKQLHGSYDFAPVEGEDDQTEVVYQLGVELAVPLPGFVKRRAEGRIMHAALDDLQAAVAS